ncbi:MAG: hypothetical protein ACYC5O_11095 [Anaerolineae bacterium]
MSDSRRTVPNEITIQGTDSRPRVDPLLLASMGQARAKSPALSGRDFATVGCAIIFVAAMGLLYLLQSAEITHLAYRVNDRRAQAERLAEVNTVLTSEILELSRLDRIEARAEALGLEKPQQTVYLNLDQVAQAATPAADSARGP